MPLILVTILGIFKLNTGYVERAVLSRHMETHTGMSAYTHTTDTTQSPTVIPERLITWSLLKVLS